MKPLVQKVIPPVAADLDEHWFARVRYALHHGRHRDIRAGESGEILIWGERLGEYQPLLLPHGGIRFATKADAVRVIEMLINK